MSEQDLFHWAKKVSRRDIRRLYESDAQGLLDEELLNQVLYTIHARVCDMFEVQNGVRLGRVICRSCGVTIPQPFRMDNKSSSLRCEQCGWETTSGAFFNSYSGKDLLPASRTDLFQDFLARFPMAETPQEKMLLIDWLIHEFHVHSGVARRLVAQNVIQGSREELCEMLATLAGGEDLRASKEAWLEVQNNPIRRFRRKYPSHDKIQAVARQLGITGWAKMPENELIAEILRLSPKLGEESDPAS